MDKVVSHRRKEICLARARPTRSVLWSWVHGSNYPNSPISRLSILCNFHVVPFPPDSSEFDILLRLPEALDPEPSNEEGK